MTRTYPVSVCIITFNEESRIRDCLESVKWADEIIVVDSFSTDKTVDICKEYTERVYRRAWGGNIDQKNHTIGLATKDWLLCLDADERLSPELTKEIQNVLKSRDTADGFFFPRRSSYLGRWIFHGDWYPDYQLRLFKRGRGRWQGTNPHGRVSVEGKTQYMKHDLYHFNYRNLSHQLKTIDNYSDIFSGIMIERNKSFSLFQLIFRPLYKFIKVYILKRGFLDGLPGFILAITNAFYIFVKYVKLWERTHGNGREKKQNEKTV